MLECPQFDDIRARYTDLLQSLSLSLLGKARAHLW